MHRAFCNSIWSHAERDSVSRIVRESLSLPGKRIYSIPAMRCHSPSKIAGWRKARAGRNQTSGASCKEIWMHCMGSFSAKMDHDWMVWDTCDWWTRLLNGRDFTGRIQLLFLQRRSQKVYIRSFHCSGILVDEVGEDLKDPETGTDTSHRLVQHASHLKCRIHFVGLGRDISWFWRSEGV